MFSFTEDDEPYLILISEGKMDIVRVLSQPKLHTRIAHIGQTVYHVRFLPEINHLLYITLKREPHSLGSISIVHIASNQQLFFETKNKNIDHSIMKSFLNISSLTVVRYHRESDDGNISYLLSCHMIDKRYCNKYSKFSDMRTFLITVDSHLAIVPHSSTHFIQLKTSNFNPIVQNIIGPFFNFHLFSDPFLIVSYSNILQFFTYFIDDHNLPSLHDIGSISMPDFIQHLVYDPCSHLLSILYETIGVDIVQFSLQIKKEKSSKDNEHYAFYDLKIVSIIKSWKGISHSAVHLLANISSMNEKKIILSLVCDKYGYISFLANHKFCISNGNENNSNRSHGLLYDENKNYDDEKKDIDISEENELHISDEHEVIWNETMLHCLETGIVKENNTALFHSIIQCKIFHQRFVGDNEEEIFAVDENGTVQQVSFVANM